MEKKLGILQSDFFKNKKVLVTGHTGFKGSWLTIWLNALGAQVIGYSLDCLDKKDNFEVTQIGKKIVDIRGDIRDKKYLTEVVHTYQPEIVFHLAAQPLVRQSYEDPYLTYETNVMGTLNLLEAIKEEASIKVGIMITTDKCYENKEQIWPYRECDAMGGKDPYSSSKACCELIVNAYIQSFFANERDKIHRKAVTSVRAGNVIGGGDWAKDRIIPDCIRSLIEQEDIMIRSPKAVRPWQFVLEPLYGYMLLAQKLWNEGNTEAQGWNFGPTLEGVWTVEEVVEQVISQWGAGRWQYVPEQNSAKEALLLNLDSTKAYQKLGWRTCLSLEESIGLTVAWYKNKTKSYEALAIEQINYYTTKLIKGGVL